MEFRTSQHIWPYMLVTVLTMGFFGLCISAPYSQDWAKDTPWKSSFPSRNTFFRNTAIDGVSSSVSTHPWSRTFNWADRSIYPMPSSYNERFRGPISVRSSDYKPRRPYNYDPWSTDRNKQNGIFGMTRYFPTED